MSGIGTTRAGQLMKTDVITVRDTDKINEVARLFDDLDINAAPVVDRNGKCIGLITSHDFVEYESVRREFVKAYSVDTPYNISVFLTKDYLRLPGNHFDEVGFHMTTNLYIAWTDTRLDLIAREMCRNHIHHVVVLDRQDHPIGILSALDLLGLTIGEKVVRSAVNSSN